MVRQQAHLGRRPVDRDARPQTSDDVERVAVEARLLVRERVDGQEQLGLAREAETGRQDADDDMAHAFDVQGTAHGIGAPAEVVLPDAVTDHHRGRAADGVLLGRKVAPELKAHTQGAEEAVGDPLARHAFRPRRSDDDRVLRPVAGHVPEAGAHAPPVQEVQVGHRRVAGFLGVLQQDYELIRLAEGQRAQHDRVHHAEDRRVGADPEREGQDHEGGEARLLELQAERVPDVGAEAHLLTPGGCRGGDADMSHPVASKGPASHRAVATPGQMAARAGKALRCGYFRGRRRNGDAGRVVTASPPRKASVPPAGRAVPLLGQPSSRIPATVPPRQPKWPNRLGRPVPAGTGRRWPPPGE
jgi:hypothetical protein